MPDDRRGIGAVDEMNHYAAREIADDNGNGTGRWRYTVANRRTGTHAIGYCASGYGCEGHDTPEGAQDHYKEYLLDTRTDLDMQMADTQRQCLVCGAWTQRMAVVHDHGSFVLCDEHCTRDEVEKRLIVGEAWGTL